MSNPERPFTPRTGVSDFSKHELETGSVFAPKFDSAGLIPAVVTDAATGELLMHAYMNEEALALTLESGEAHYWSRSRAGLWKKGETSGQIQDVVELRTDCDQDTIWLKVSVRGNGASCHVGYHTCFYRVAAMGEDHEARLSIAETRVYDPKEVYGKS